MTQHRSTRLALFGIGLLISLGASAGPGFSSLEERMTGQEFRETGLYKLSDEELAALNRWIQQRSLAEGEAVQGQAGPGAEAEDRRGLRSGGSDRSPIRSRITGPFSGWDGRTVFELENGQVWRQIESGSFSVREMENPEVEIIPGLFNSWNLRVQGYNRRVGVERIR